MVGRYMLALIITSFFASAVYALPAHYGPYYVGGSTYYIINATNGSLNSGDRVCAAVGMKCVGLTDYNTALCHYVHPNATVLNTLNGSSSAYYCNGPPQGGQCSTYYNTCFECSACNPTSCQDQIGDQFREMYAQCASNGTVTTVPQYGTFAYMLWFWSTLLPSIHPIQQHLFGFSPVHTSTSNSGNSGNTPAAATRLCPMACYLYTAGIGNGGSQAVNCNVNQSNVYKALPTCAGTQSQVGQGVVGCSCQPDPVQNVACPASCNTTQAGCSVNPAAIGKSGIPCDGTVPGTSQNCKCAYINSQWAVGAQHGIN